MGRVRAWLLLLVVVALPMAGCTQTSEAEPERGPALIEPIEGSDVARITLTEEAADRIGIETAVVQEGPVEHVLPTVGVVLADDQDPGLVLVRVALNRADFERVDHGVAARVLPARSSEEGVFTANLAREEQAAGYGDGAIYYAAPATQGLVLGQRPRVELPLKGSGERHLTIPYAAVLYDGQGATWVYTSPRPLVFMREPIEVDHIANGVSVLTRGPRAGTAVVIVGVTELYGAEVGVGE